MEEISPQVEGELNSILWEHHRYIYFEKIKHVDFKQKQLKKQSYFFAIAFSRISAYNKYK